MDGVLLILSLVLACVVFAKGLTTVLELDEKDEPRHESNFVEDLKALNRDLRALLASRGYVLEDSRGNDESENRRRFGARGQQFFDDEIDQWNYQSLNWDDELFGSAPTPAIEWSRFASEDSLFDDHHAHGNTMNPASGLPMISGDMSGVDSGGNLFGSSWMSDSADSIGGFDSFGSTSSLDSSPSFDSFGASSSMSSDPFSNF